MEETKGPLATMMGTYYPQGYVVGVIHARAGAEQAAEAFRDAGFGGEEVRVFTGDWVLN